MFPLRELLLLLYRKINTIQTGRNYGQDIFKKYAKGILDKTS